MAFEADIKKVTIIDSADTVVIEKVRWSLRQRLRKQMSKLSSDLFDEVDDFLFSSGQKGQLTNDCVYLKAMREMRAKQALFEEHFLDSVMETIKASYRERIDYDDAADDASITGEPVYERVEVDLALQAVRRKAEKMYAPFIKQIGANQDKAIGALKKEVIGSDVLVTATIEGFARAQAVFALSLDVRLIFIKLFEQHFVLKMEKLFLDIISIINNVNDHCFIEKLYSSSSALKTRIVPQDKEKTRLQRHRSAIAQRGSQKAELVETAVSQLIAAICEQGALPLFVEKMIRTKWRVVMFLIGLNRGSFSVEWSEAKHTLSLLVTAIQDGVQLDTADRQSLFDQLRQGFSLAQMGKTEQEEFLIELEKYFETGTQDDATVYLRPGSVIEKPAETEARPTEAYINPTGEDILDQNDMNEIAKLLGGDDEKSEANQRSNSVNQRQLDEYLNEIDQLGDKVLVEFMVNGAYESCTLSKNASNPELFNLRDRSSTFSVSRSRLGLAVALQNGELRIPEFNVTKSTVLESRLPSSRVRH